MGKVIKIIRGLEETQEIALGELHDVVDKFQSRGAIAFGIAMVLPDGSHTTMWYNSKGTSIVLQAAVSMLNFRVHKEALEDAENSDS